MIGSEDVNTQIQSVNNVLPANSRNVRTEDVDRQQNNFANVFKTALDQVSKAEKSSDQKTELLALGKIDNLHDVMITAQKANIMVESTVQIQQKVIDTYNEMMRMQV